MVKNRAGRRDKIGKDSSIFPLNTRKILDLDFFGRDKTELLKYLIDLTRSDRNICWICTVNPEFVVLAQKEPNFKRTIKSCNIRVIDGVGLLWAEMVLRKKGFLSRVKEGVKSGKKIIRGGYRQGLISGSDLIEDLVKEGRTKKMKYFFLGGWGDRSKRTAKVLAGKYPGIKVAWSPGEPALANEEVLSQIKKFSPDFLFVAYGMRRQEEWIYKNLGKIKSKVVIGVGRSFDYYSGELKRAPLGWRKMGLEWLYSLIQEPKRWRRQLALPKFVWMVLRNS